MNNDKLITILGATGDLGSQFSNHLIAKNFKLRLVIRKGTQETLKRRVNINANVEVMEVETLFNKSLLEKILTSSKIVFNLTGLVSLCFKDKTFPSVLLINSFLQGFLAKYNETRNIPILYASTQRIDALSGKNVDSWISMTIEEFNIYFNKTNIKDNFHEIALDFTKKLISRNPIPADVNIYDLSKALGEEFLKQTRAIILRVSSCYGPGCSTRRTIGRLIFSRMLEETKTEDVDIRDYIYIKDINEIFERMIFLDNKKTYINYCCSGVNNRKEYVISEIIKNTQEYKGELKTNSNKLKKDTFKPSGKWVRGILKREPSSIEKGIALTVDAFRRLYFSQHNKATRERLHALYDNIKQRTEENGIDPQEIDEAKNSFMFSNGTWHAHKAFWKPTGIVLGYPFPNLLIDKLDRLGKDILLKLGLSPEQFWLIERNLFHITIITYSHYNEAGIDMTFLPKSEFEKVKNVVSRFKPITISLDGVLINDNGSLLAKGFVDNEDLFFLRRQLLAEIEGITQRQSKIVHIKLAHILCDIPHEDTEKINRLYSSFPIGEYTFKEARTSEGKSLKFS